ncbi:hypothetical protein BJX61DRAFT_301928 [Aspergillus egyptiacus]|nr:hypothetical protein BJX61DRAFT_301928 [Aspergillus egyptiacus]
MNTQEWQGWRREQQRADCGLVTSTCPIRSQQVRSESPMKTQEWQGWRREQQRANCGLVTSMCPIRTQQDGRTGGRNGEEQILSLQDGDIDVEGREKVKKKLWIAGESGKRGGWGLANATVGRDPEWIQILDWCGGRISESLRHLALKTFENGSNSLEMWYSRTWKVGRRKGTIRRDSSWKKRSKSVELPAVEGQMGQIDRTG